MVLTEGFLGGFLCIACFFMTVVWALVVGFTTVVTLVEGLITVCAFFDVCTTVLTLAVGFTNVREYFDVCTTVLILVEGSIKVCDFLVV